MGTTRRSFLMMAGSVAAALNMPGVASATDALERAAGKTAPLDVDKIENRPDAVSGAGAGAGGGTAALKKVIPVKRGGFVIEHVKYTRDAIDISNPGDDHRSYAKGVVEAEIVLRGWFAPGELQLALVPGTEVEIVAMQEEQPVPPSVRWYAYPAWSTYLSTMPTAMSASSWRR